LRPDGGSWWNGAAQRSRIIYDSITVDFEARWTITNSSVLQDFFGRVDRCKEVISRVGLLQASEGGIVGRPSRFTIARDEQRADRVASQHLPRCINAVAAVGQLDINQGEIGMQFASESDCVGSIRCNADNLMPCFGKIKSLGLNNEVMILNKKQPHDFPTPPMFLNLDCPYTRI